MSKMKLSKTGKICESLATESYRLVLTCFACSCHCTELVVCKSIERLCFYRSMSNEDNAYLALLKCLSTFDYCVFLSIDYVCN